MLPEKINFEISVLGNPVSSFLMVCARVYATTGLYLHPIFAIVINFLQLSFQLIKYTTFNQLCFNPSSVLSKCGFWIIYLQKCTCSLIVLFFLFLFKEATIHNLPISHDNPPCFTKNLEKPLFLIPLGIIVAPREIQNSASASFFVCLFVCLFFLGGGLITGDVKMRSLRQSLVIKKSCSILISQLTSCPLMHYVLTIDLVIWCMRK